MYTSSSFGTTNNGAAKCSLKNEDRDDNFDVRPPSGTNHQVIQKMGPLDIFSSKDRCVSISY